MLALHRNFGSAKRIQTLDQFNARNVLYLGGNVKLLGPKDMGSCADMVPIAIRTAYMCGRSGQVDFKGGSTVTVTEHVVG